MTTMPRTSPANTIVEADWLFLDPGTAATVSDLLAAPILRDAPTITWYAAGHQNTWLRITKTNGAVELHTFSHDLVQSVPKPLYRGDFHPRMRLPHSERFAPEADLEKNLYAIALMAYAAYDAWCLNRWPLHDEMLTTLSRYVPTLAQAFARADATDGIQIQGPNFRGLAYLALHAIDAIEALADEPRGQAMLDPWFRAQQMLRVASEGRKEGGGARTTTLYIFEGEKPSYMLVVPQPSECSSAFNMWLDEDMTPLLVDYKHNGEACYLENTGIAWDHPRPLPTTLQGWQEGFKAMDSVDIFQSLVSGRCRMASPSETLEAIEKWIHNTTPMQHWDRSNNDEAIVHLGQWALQIWMKHHSQMGPLMQSLLPTLDPDGPASQLDAWRQFVVLANNEKKTRNPNVESEQLGALLNTG